MLVLAALLARLHILVAVLRFVPLRGDEDLAGRAELAGAIYDGTLSILERRLLVRIARMESDYDPRVARCDHAGGGTTADPGLSFGYFQIKPFTHDEGDRACGSADAQVALALERIRLSRRTCRQNAPELQLAAYTSGSCDRGHYEARMRWGGPGRW